MSSDTLIPSMSMSIVTIIHSPALKARDQHVRNMCAAFTASGATVAIVMGPEPPIHDPAQLAAVVNMDPNKLGDKAITAAFRPLIADMKVRQLSNGLKHAAAVQYIASLADQGHADDSWHFVLEDDAMIHDVPALLAACASAPVDADMLFFGLPSALPHPTGGTIRYDALQGIKLLPTCDCYALRMHTARFLSTSVLPIRFRTEIHLSWLIASTCIKTYLTSPNLSVDGSKVGMFVSGVESNNTLSFNSEYALLSSLKLTDIDTETFVARIKAMPFGEHPDAQVLLGRRLAESGRHADAIAVFAAALAVYTSEGAAVGNDSAFMRTYMDLFKHVQQVV